MNVTRAIAAIASILFAAVFSATGMASAAPPPWTDQLHAQASQAEGRANSWAVSSGSSAPGWKHVYRPSETTCYDPAVSQLSWYCGGQGIVNLTPQAVISWSGAGPAGLNYLMGHETTHHLQAPGPAGPAREQQASCGAGVFLKWLGTPESHIQTLISRIRNGSGTIHGSMDALADAVRPGYDSGSLAACVHFAGPITGA